MYHDFYQLKENPFNTTADPAFFYRTRSHEEALSNLTYGIKQRKGILVLTGDVGTGKTTLCRKLIRQSNKRFKFAFIVAPAASELELLQMIVHEFGIKTREKNVFGLMRALDKFLIKEYNKNHTAVLVIDEAQNLTIGQLEQIRLLSNLETEKEKKLQIILVGLPKLDQTLQIAELTQLNQRITIYTQIKPLEKIDLKNYIYHRMIKVVKTPGAIGDITFDDAALDAIFHHTQGVPRKINIVCDRALLSGFVAETFMIDEPIIENVVKEVLYCEHHL